MSEPFWPRHWSGWLVCAACCALTAKATYWAVVWGWSLVSEGGFAALLPGWR